MRSHLSSRWLVVVLALAACSPGRDLTETADAALSLSTSDAARDVLRTIDARFRSRVASIDGPETPTNETQPLLARSTATFETTGNGLRARVSGATTSVTLPDRARGLVQLDSAEHRFAFALVGANDTKVELADGFAVYAGGGPEGADVVHRVDVGGTEDHLIFTKAPARPEVRYRIDLGTLIGVRLIDGVVELVDREGAPRFRMRAPWLVDAAGAHVDARVSVEGCAVDRDPRAPWGRPVVPAGHTSCEVRIDWPPTLAYPALLDPTWVATSTGMTTTRAWHGAQKLGGGKVLLVGGSYVAGTTPAYLSSAELYDPTTKSFAATGAMTAPRARHTVVMLGDGKVLVAGGTNTAGALSTAETYDPTSGLWTATGAMTEPRTRHQAVIVSSGRVLVAGGAGSLGPLSTAEVFDPTARTFTATGTMTWPRRDFQMFPIDGGKVLAAMGYANKYPDVALSQAEAYEPLTGVWSSAGGASPDRSLHAGAKLADGRVLVAGGYSVGSSNNVNAASIFTPSTGAWATTGSMGTRRQQFTMTTLGNGAVLVAGGVNADRDGNSPTTFFSTSELFTGSGFTSTSMPSMAAARYAHTASLLDDGTVLVAGGNNALGALGTSELFDLSVNGQPCSSSLMCKSGFCVDGVCCASACTTACYACTNATTGSADGTCAPVKIGTDPKNSCKDDGAPTCLQNGLCDGAGACQKYAVSTGCTPQACTTGSQCSTGYCYDGVCCNTACSGTCRACTAAKKGYGADGLCEPVKDGTDPDAECGTTGTGLCAGDGVCNGSGACRTPLSGTVCAAAACVGNVANGESTCSAAGVCTPKTSVNCGAYACDSATGTCRTTCTGDGDCATGVKCTGGVCTAKPNGATCAAGSECTSGFCADGVCCNSACTGQCEACDVVPAIGVCSVVFGEPHGTRTKCSGAGDPKCGAQCDGTSRTSCRTPSSTTVCASACSGTSAIERRCNGSGTCNTSTTTRSCSPYTCDAATGACRKTCTADGDCATGYACVSGTCRTPSSVNNCDGSAVIRSDGTRVECAPYGCSNGSCRTTCTSGSQCAKDALCDTKNHFCYVPGGSSDSGGGCGCSIPHHDDGEGIGAAVAALLAAVWMRRRVAKS